MSIPPIDAIGAVAPSDLQAAPLPPSRSAVGGGFERLFMDGLAKVDDKLKAADALAIAFSVDDTIPPHRVMFALEDARLSFELMLQIRSRLVEGYQDLMRMQL